MAFSMKGAPYCNCTLNTPIYHRDIDGGALGMANDNGTIIVAPNQSPEEEEKVLKHEKVHLDQMERGDLSYDETSVTWKGKRYLRKNMDEGDKTLPWEKEAYNA
tara:strand:- start:2275 stop:2586 length:312 start_codon:yes stop_codon:yes gene_type:complete